MGPQASDPPPVARWFHRMDRSIGSARGGPWLAHFRGWRSAGPRWDNLGKVFLRCTGVLGQSWEWPLVGLEGLSSPRACSPFGLGQIGPICRRGRNLGLPQVAPQVPQIAQSYGGCAGGYVSGALATGDRSSICRLRGLAHEEEHEEGGCERGGDDDAEGYWDDEVEGDFGPVFGGHGHTGLAMGLLRARGVGG
jgi:hypothetical protein